MRTFSSLPLQAHQGILKQLVDLIGTTSIMEVQQQLCAAKSELFLLLYPP